MEHNDFYKDFYDLAVALVDAPPSDLEEAAERTAVSRVYYAGYHYARKLMEGWGCPISRKGTAHAEVVHGLKCSGQTDIIEMGEELENLMLERQRADYQIEDAQTFDMPAIYDRYGYFTRNLKSRWQKLSAQARATALDKIQRRVASLQKRR